MVKYLMDSNTQEDSFYLYNHDALIQKIEQSTKPILLFGVSFALLDFADKYASNKPFTIIETGGMKGRKIEITKVVKDLILLLNNEVLIFPLFILDCVSK